MIIKIAWNDVSYKITMFVAGAIRDLLYKKAEICITLSQYTLKYLLVSSDYLFDLF